MGGYDLYGQYYPNINDAINAEMAQCNEIDNMHNQKAISDMRRQLSQQKPYSEQEEIYRLTEAVKELSKRIDVLESNQEEKK